MKLINLENNSQDSIYANASPNQKSGLIVIRVSGPHVQDVIKQLQCKQPEIRYATLTNIYHPVTNQLLDKAVIIFYKGPNSFTGEDVLELNIHGSKAVCNLLLDALSKIDGLRFAEPGEFSMRSFANGKMDLTQLEGLVDLIEAETEAQHTQSLRQMSGELGKLYNGWRQNIIKILSMVEAIIDFPDDEIPEETSQFITQQITDLSNNIITHLDDGSKGEKLRDGAYVVILGQPNAGKSSIINRIAKRDVAIVSEIEGTTRDVIEINLDLKGYPITIADTAGLRESFDMLENEGIKRSLQRAESADLKIVVFDSSTYNSSYNEISDLIDENSIIVFNKSDISERDAVEKTKNIFREKNIRSVITLSTKENTGIDTLLKEISSFMEDYFSITRESPLITRQRYRDNLASALANLNSAKSEQDIVLAAEELRMSAHYIGRITGQIDVESILGEIFSNFCIGK